jgi:hypothetical protein
MGHASHFQSVQAAKLGILLASVPFGTGDCILASKSGILNGTGRCGPDPWGRELIVTQYGIIQIVLRDFLEA